MVDWSVQNPYPSGSQAYWAFEQQQSRAPWQLTPGPQQGNTYYGPNPLNGAFGAGSSGAYGGSMPNPYQSPYQMQPPNIGGPQQPYGMQPTVPSFGAPYQVQTPTGVQQGGNAMAGANTGPGSDFYNQTFGALANPSQAVLQSLFKMGVDPTSGNPLVQFVLQRANDVIAPMWTQLARMPGMDPQQLASSLPGMIDQQVRNAVTTGSFRNGLGGAQSQLQSLMGAANSAQGLTAGMTNPAQALIRDYLADPNQATNLISSLLYSGFNNKLGDSLSRPLSVLPQAYTGAAAMGRAGGTNNILDALLRGVFNNPYGT